VDLDAVKPCFMDGVLSSLRVQLHVFFDLIGGERTRRGSSRKRNVRG
jgi:hypothetical protein